MTRHTQWEWEGPREGKGSLKGQGSRSKGWAEEWKSKMGKEQIIGVTAALLLAVAATVAQAIITECGECDRYCSVFL